MTWETEADADHYIPILTEDEELIWSGMGSMTAYLAAEREEAEDHDGWGADAARTLLQRWGVTLIESDDPA